jgi:hypothetical protein
MRKTETSRVRASLRVRRPNKETRRALSAARTRKNLETFASVKKWAKKVRAL